MLSLQQTRAKGAFLFVRDHWNEDIEIVTKKLPVMLHTNGLLATWAFLLAGFNKYKDLLQDLLRHLRGIQKLGIQIDDPHQMIKDWTSPNTSFEALAQLTDELIQYSVWLKRASEAMSKD